MKIPEILIVETVHQPGSLARVLQVIAEAGLAIEHLTALRRGQGRTVWEITLEMDEEADRSLYDRIDQLPNARFLGKSDRVFNRHRGGKIRTVASLPINTRQVLRDVYTPGVARVCLAIKQDPQLAHDYTSIDNTVAVITNGTAVLGLGNIGPLAGLPGMGGKAALFADLAGLSAVPILLEETQPEKVVDHIAAIHLSFGAIQLEDFAAPECFEIESRLRERLAKPVLHDDQHGTAVVVLAALINAARRARRSLPESTVGQIGLGAADPHHRHVESRQPVGDGAADETAGADHHHPLGFDWMVGVMGQHGQSFGCRAGRPKACQVKPAATRARPSIRR